MPISGPVTNPSQMDELAWTKVSDQFGVVDSSGSDWYNDVTVKTINGTTYVAMTSVNGDVELYSYNTATSSLTMLATHRGSNSFSNQTYLDMNDPQILEVDGKIAIVGGDQAGNILGYTYDPALGASTVDNDNRLVEETSLQTRIYGTGEDETFTFQAANGETYFISQQANGSFDGGQITTDASGSLIFDHHVESNNGFRTDLETANVLVGEVRTTTHAENYNVADGARTVSFEQIGDTVYEYVGSNSDHGSFKMVKWTVGADGQLNGSQVIYEDGTTVDDLAALGYTAQPFPAVSPVDGSSEPLDNMYLNDLSGLPIHDNATGTVDALDMRDIRAIETFTSGDKTYMFVGTWGGGQDGAAIFEFYPATVMPSRFIYHVEGEVSNQASNDDDIFSFADSMVDITVQEVAGGIVVSAVSQSSVMHFGFDPNGTTGTGNPSDDPNTTGALTYIGAEGADRWQTYNIDTDGTDYIGYTSQTQSSNQSFVKSYEILPDGKVLVVNLEAAWIADPGASEVGTGGPDGVVDGEETGEVMGVGYDDADGATDGGGDEITNNADSIEGNGGDDTIDGGGGDDTIDGGADNDSIIGGAGNDSILGGTGTDTIDGGEGVDTIDGGDGDDDIVAGGGDSVSGGTGDDEFTVDPSVSDTGNITIVGGELAEEDGTDSTNNPDGRVGDVLDLSGLDNVVVTYSETDPTWDGETSESGTVTYTNDNGDTITINFSEIEHVINPDFIVEGSSAGELIDASYTGDPDGDMVDNNDHSDGSNDDSIDAGEGNDTIIAGEGDDTVRADEGDDSVEGGAGNDSIFGFEGSDTVDGGDGDDYINTRTSPGTGDPDREFIVPDNPLTTTVDESQFSYGPDVDPSNDLDSVDGGTGNDTILTGDDDDTIVGGTGEDSIDAGFDDDSVYAGADNDTIVGGEGQDTIFGEGGDDIIYGGLDPNATYTYNGQTVTGAQINAIYSVVDAIDPDPTNNNDSLVGGDGNDQIYGADDEDTLEGGTGDDTLDGGIDDDSIIGGTGDDELIGGEGDDTFVIADPGQGDGADTITDFGDGISGPINDDDQSNNDFVDLTAYYNQANYDAAVAAGEIDPTMIKNPLQWLQADQADDGILNDTNAGWTATDTLTIQNSGSAVAASELNFDTTGVICFARGTRIATAMGEKTVETLEVGDRVITRDNGIRQIRWIGSTKREAKGSTAPISFKKGSIGNHSDLIVSPNHRMLVRNSAAQLWVEDHEVLVPAKFMVDGKDIVKVEGGEVEYFHVLFDQHEIILAEGAWSESFHPGHVGFGTLSEETRIEILELFPELENMKRAEGWATARKVLNQREAAVVFSTVGR